MYFQNLPINEATFRQWARGVLGGRGTSLGDWTGKGGLFSRADYNALTDYLMRSGLMRWVNPAAHAQGRELTAAGRATLRKFVNQKSLEVDE